MTRWGIASGQNGRCSKLAFCLFAALVSTAAKSIPPPDQQTAIVTFYVHGTATGGLYPGSKHGTFDGLIFDGNNALVSFQEGIFIHNNRFITLRLPAGPHDFVATMNAEPHREGHVVVTLLPGHQYFLRAQYDNPIVSNEGAKARLDPVTCEEAHKDAPNAKSLHPKHPSAALLTQLVSTEEMPPCQ
jgi:hypothetical protein